MGGWEVLNVPSALFCCDPETTLFKKKKKSSLLTKRKESPCQNVHILTLKSLGKNSYRIPGMLSQAYNFSTWEVAAKG